MTGGTAAPATRLRPLLRVLFRPRTTTNGVGYVPEENIVGRAELIFLSVSEDGSTRPDRLLTRVR